MNTQKLINLRTVSWRYEDRKAPALDNIRLSVAAGTAVGITGPSGAGKSTLLLAAAGLIPANYAGDFAGEIQVNGEIGIVFQDPETQFVGLSVEEEIAFALENRGCSDADIERRIRDALSTVGLSGFEKRSPFELSGGEKQRVAIAAALATDPEILILDDPTSELDPVGARDVFSLLHDLKREKRMTIVVSSHDIEALADFCDRLVMLDAGHIIKDCRVEEFFADPEEIESYGIYVPDMIKLQKWIMQPDWLQTLDSLERQSTCDTDSYVRTVEENGALHSSQAIAPFIEFQRVSFSYKRDKPVLKEINLTIDKGEFVCLVGGNGSGKTTLSKHINGLYKPSSGHVIVNGTSTSEVSVVNLASTVSYCYQNPDHQIFQPTIWQEVAFGPKNLGLGDQEVNERVREALAAVGLEHMQDEEPSFVGKGDRQKIAVASVLAMKPEVIVLDEPTTGLDYRGVSEMMGLIQRLNRAGHTIIAVSHDMRLVAQHASRVVVLYQGEIVLDGSPADVFMQTDILNRAQIEPPQVIRYAMNAGYTEPLPLTFADLQNIVGREAKLKVRGLSS